MSRPTLESSPTTDPFASNYDEIFGQALDSYKKQTGQDLNAHTVAKKPNNFESPDAVLQVLEEKVQACKFSGGNELLMTWLESYVYLLFAVSEKLWESTEAVSLKGLTLSVLRYYNVSFSASLAGENNLYCHSCSP
jgi:hypothetical protein